MNISLRRACFKARRLPFALPLSSPSHHAQRTGHILQQLRAFNISSRLAARPPRGQPAPPRHFPSEAELKAEQFAHKEASNQKQGLLYALFVANTAVFVAWTYSKVLAHQANDPTSTRKAHQWIDFMQNNFIRSEENVRKGRWWTNLTSAISQENILHFGVNMWALRNAGSYIVMGMPQVGLLSFAALCVGSALAGSAGAQLSNTLTGDPRGGLGASGMLCGVMSAATCAFPQALGINTAIWFAIDLGVLSSGAAEFSPLGHGAHLGGTVFGVLFYLVAIRRGRFPRMK